MMRRTPSLRGDRTRPALDLPRPPSEPNVTRRSWNDDRDAPDDRPDGPGVADALARSLGRVLRRMPAWAGVAAISGASAGLTVGVVLAAHAIGPGYGDGLRCALLVGGLLPLVVSVPVGWVVIGLLRALEREHEKALALARRDTLTGLVNRRTLLDHAQRDVGLARRSARPFAVALLDLDDFKSVNDRHGHAVGDALLRAIADVCRQTVRSTDVVARWGGEEMVVAMPDTDGPGAATTMERVRVRIGAVRVATPDGGTVGCTASIGIACLAPGDEAAAAQAVLEGLVLAADRAMYTAKQAGKDRLVIAQPASPSHGERPATH
jgi:diguanylate cyclase (GGDEF)-like protein